MTKAWDASGLSFRSNRHVFVYEGLPGAVCPAALGTANICLPGDDTAGSLHVVANGYGSFVPTAAQLYVDGVLVLNDTSHSTALDTILPVGEGQSRTLVFKFWDASGLVAVVQKTVQRP